MNQDLSRILLLRHIYGSNKFRTIRPFFEGTVHRSYKLCSKSTSLVMFYIHIYNRFSWPQEPSNPIHHSGRFRFSGNGTKSIRFESTCEEDLKRCWDKTQIQVLI